MDLKEFLSADFTSLHHFVLVAQAGSFSRGALAAAVSQPTISRHVMKLERELGSRLLDRTSKGVALTPTGRRLFDAVLPSFEQLITARRLATAENDDESLRNVTMGLPPSVGNILGVRLLNAVRRQFPRLSLHLREGFHRPLVDALHQEKLDFALFYTMVPAAGIHFDHLLDDELCLVMTPARARNKRWISLSQVADYPLSLPSRPHGLRELVEQQAALHHLTLDIRHELDTSLTMTKQVPLTNLAATVLPFSAVFEEVAQGSLVALPIRNPTLSRRLVLAFANNRPLSAGLRKFQHLVRAECAALVREGVWKGATVPGAGT